MAKTNPEKPEAGAAFTRFEDLARRLFAVPKYELDEEIAKEQAENKAEKPARKTKRREQKAA